MERTPSKNGWVEVICGPMFSGKSEELIRRVRRAKIAKQRVLIFKPVVDIRYSKDAVTTHSELSMKAHRIADPRHIFKGSIVVGNPQVVAFDEAQFLGDHLIPVVSYLADKGIRVIVAGLDTDYLGNPFGPMPTLMCEAEYVTKLQAICVRCGQPANRSLRTKGSEEQVEVGGQESYEAVCRACYGDANPQLKRSYNKPPARTPNSLPSSQSATGAT